MSCTAPPVQQVQQLPEPVHYLHPVEVCNNGYTQVYHTKNCEGILKCNRSITMELDSAVKKYRHCYLCQQ
jgi:hypothetical protein